MNLKDRQKMCSQCDGRIPYEAEQCPYCGADVAKAAGQAFINSGSEQHNRSLQDSLTAPYSPSAAKTGAAGSRLDLGSMSSSGLERRRSPMTQTSGAPAMAQVAAAPQEASVSTEGRKMFLPILLLSLGGNLMTIGLLLLLFSHEGVLRLEWDATYWFAYCLGATPLLVYGLKKAKEMG